MSDDDRVYLDKFPQRSLLGVLLYLSINTRPDNAYAVGLQSRFGSKPTVQTCHLMEYLKQYVRGTVLCGIRFSKHMHVFTDADWAGDVLTRRSAIGYVVFALLAWQSRHQTTVATSSMTSEYQAMYAGMKEIVWLRGVLAELDLRLCKPTPFFLDSQNAEDLALNLVYHKQSKHIDPDGEFRTATLTYVRTGAYLFMLQVHMRAFYPIGLASITLG